MSTIQTEGKDEALWEIAKKRASFRSHLVVYVIINAFLWGMYLFSGHSVTDDTSRFPWPLWTTLGWGLGLAFHFAGAYVFHNSNSVEREYEKLKNKH
ncbi:MAG: 2TM domain-containing protein [Ferruginibacter sp.]